MSYTIQAFPCVIDSENTEQTENIGRALAEQLMLQGSLPRYIALRGDLGVGKTAFVRGFASFIAPGAPVRSPTFSLVNEYRTIPSHPPVFHFDMYRITSEDDLYSIGYDDYPERGFCLVEWSENIPYALPDHYLTVTIEKCDLSEPDRRRITLDLI